jgi:hypothetical protein
MPARKFETYNMSRHLKVSFKSDNQKLQHQRDTPQNLTVRATILRAFFKSAMIAACICIVVLVCIVTFLTRRIESFVAVDSVCDSIAAVEFPKPSAGNRNFPTIASRYSKPSDASMIPNNPAVDSFVKERSIEVARLKVPAVQMNTRSSDFATFFSGPLGFPEDIDNIMVFHDWAIWNFFKQGCDCNLYIEKGRKFPVYFPSGQVVPADGTYGGFPMIMLGDKSQQTILHELFHAHFTLFDIPGIAESLAEYFGWLGTCIYNNVTHEKISHGFFPNQYYILADKPIDIAFASITYAYVFGDMLKKYNVHVYSAWHLWHFIKCEYGFLALLELLKLLTPETVVNGPPLAEANSDVGSPCRKDNRNGNCKSLAMRVIEGMLVNKGLGTLQDFMARYIVTAVTNEYYTDDFLKYYIDDKPARTSGSLYWLGYTVLLFPASLRSVSWTVGPSPSDWRIVIAQFTLSGWISSVYSGSVGSASLTGVTSGTRLPRLALVAAYDNLQKSDGSKPAWSVVFS